MDLVDMPTIEIKTIIDEIGYSIQHIESKLKELESIRTVVNILIDSMKRDNQVHLRDLVHLQQEVIHLRDGIDDKNPKI